jgi:pyruvate kinase
MLESMTGKPRPTRAEVSDVAAAIFGGTDAVMLSGETAVGAYPVESVRQMAAIAETVEEHMADTGELEPLFSTSVLYAIADSVCHGAYAAARDLGARAVFVSTTSGRTALLFSKYRFSGVLVGASDDESAVRRMALYWGVRPIRVPRCRSHQVLLERMTKVSMERGYVSEGDTLIFLAGSPLGKTGATNTMIVHRIKPAVRDGKADFVEGRTAGGTLRVDRQACIMCGACLGACPVEVFAFSKDRLVLKRANLKKCLSDWRCRDICPVDAIEVKGAKEGEARK